MTREEILEYNKLCAEFLGYKYFPYPNVNSGWRKEQGHLKLSEYYLARTTKDLKFYSDWNWIMRMVDSIETKGYDVFLNGLYCRITDSGLTNFEIESDRVKNKKQAVIQAIYEFLKYYNNENN